MAGRGAAWIRSGLHAGRSRHQRGAAPARHGRRHEIGPGRLAASRCRGGWIAGSFGRRTSAPRDLRLRLPGGWQPVLPVALSQGDRRRWRARGVGRVGPAGHRRRPGSLRPRRTVAHLRELGPCVPTMGCRDIVGLGLLPFSVLPSANRWRTSRRDFAATLEVAETRYGRLVTLDDDEVLRAAPGSEMMQRVRRDCAASGRN